MDDDFLLCTETARRLFHDQAENMPIIDYHCHLSPKEIAEDKRYSNMAEVWLGGDHYKWRAMRSDGVPERFITGNASDYEKFEKWASVLPKLAGNPLYHWTHLELQRYFNIYDTLSPATCQSIWTRCNEKLRDMSARKFIEQMNVKVLCTTDDPCDSLEYHARLAAEKNASFKMLPAWRPDKALNIDKPGFSDDTVRLSASAGVTITDLEDFKRALCLRMDHFQSLGCCNSDHGLDYIVHDCSVPAESVFSKAMNGEELTQLEADSYKAEMLLFLAGEYTRRRWVMQLHYGAVRNVNRTMFASLGADTGYDAIWGSADCGLRLAKLLGRMEAEGRLPKTILYSLNPSDNAIIGALIGCFQSEEARGRLQQGCAWWFNDSIKGMREQLASLASLSVLGNFIGMVTDSRSFLSYTRHEYFRRIVCDMLGAWVENGEYPADHDSLGKIVRGICFDNAKAFFNF